MSASMQTPNLPAKPAPMPVGGAPIAIVPQTFEEIQRIAAVIIAGGMAPTSLVKKAKPSENLEDVHKHNVAAVSAVLMAGAEVGLPPMTALRSFMFFNGRVALYADGNVAVARKSDKCVMVDMGFTRFDPDILIKAHVLPSDATEKRFPGSQQAAWEALSDDEKAVGFCTARRSDGQEKTVVFSIADAKIAGLWDPEEMAEKEVWEGPSGSRSAKLKMMPNESTWHRFWKRMLMWRAAGYCLRDIFADVLGGLMDEFEAREIADYRDITPRAEAQAAIPDAPADEEEVAEIPATAPPEGESRPVDVPVKAGLGDALEAKAAESAPVGESDEAAFLEMLEGELAFATNVQSVEEIWSENDVERTLYGNDDALTKAFEIKKFSLDRVNPIPAQEAAAKAAGLARGIEDAKAALAENAKKAADAVVEGVAAGVAEGLPTEVTAAYDKWAEEESDELPPDAPEDEPEPTPRAEGVKDMFNPDDDGFPGDQPFPRMTPRPTK